MYVQKICHKDTFYAQKLFNIYRLPSMQLYFILSIVFHAITFPLSYFMFNVPVELKPRFCNKVESIHASTTMLANSTCGIIDYFNIFDILKFLFPPRCKRSSWRCSNYCTFLTCAYQYLFAILFILVLEKIVY